MAWQQHLQAKPMGARLHEARTKLQKCERTIREVATRVTKAITAYEEAEAETEEARRMLAALQHEDAGVQGEVVQRQTVQQLMQAAQQAADWIESHPFGPAGSGPPSEGLIQSVMAIRAAV